MSREGRALVRCILPQQRGGVDGPAIDRLGEGVPSGLESADAQPRKKGRDEGRHQDSAAGLGRGARARTRAHDFRRAGRRRVLMASVLQHLQPSSYMRFSDLSASYVFFSNLSSLLPSARFCTNVGARVRTNQQAAELAIRGRAQRAAGRRAHSRPTDRWRRACRPLVHRPPGYSPPTPVFSSVSTGQEPFENIILWFSPQFGVRILVIFSWQSLNWYQTNFAASLVCIKYHANE